MNRTAILTLVSAMILGFTFSAAAQQKIAVIDLEKVVRLHPNTAEDKKAYEKTFKEFEAEKETLQAKAKAAAKEFETAAREASNQALSEAKRKDAAEKALNLRDAALRAEKEAIETIRDRQRQLDAQERKMLKRTVDEIELAIKRFSEAKGIDLVLPLPSARSGVGAVIYSKPELDITSDIMKVIGIPEPQPISSDVVAVPGAVPAGAKAD